MEKVVISATETVVVERERGSVITSGALLNAGAGSGTSSITYANDVDISELSNGSVLVYNSTNLRWKATKVLEQQTIECGQF